MELKLKEGVDLSLPITQNGIELMAIELLGNDVIHTTSEVYVELMIATVDKMVEGGIITQLADLKGEELLSRLQTVIEPFYCNVILIQNKEAIDKMLSDLMRYFETVYQQQNSLGGLINFILDALTNLDDKDLDTIKSLVNTYNNGNTQRKVEKSLLVEKEKTSKHLEELIKQYEKSNE